MPQPMSEGRRADSERRRQRVLRTIADALRAKEPITVSGIARKAGVDRTFFYRHQDLLAQVHAAEMTPGPGDGAASPVTWASLQADLVNAQERNNLLNARVRQLEGRLSQALGDQAWKESGLGPAADIDQLQRKINNLEQHQVELRGHLEERVAELDAARAANRELTRLLNQARSARH